MMNTIRVVIMVSRRVGQVTFWVSARTSCRNLNGLTRAIEPDPRTYRRTARTAGRSRHLAIYTQDFRKGPSRGWKATSSRAGGEGLDPPPPGLGDGCSSH